MAQLRHCFGFNLTNSFTSHPEGFADLIEGLGDSVTESEYATQGNTLQDMLQLSLPNLKIENDELRKIPVFLSHIISR